MRGMAVLASQARKLVGDFRRHHGASACVRCGACLMVGCRDPRPQRLHICCCTMPQQPKKRRSCVACLEK